MLKAGISKSGDRSAGNLRFTIFDWRFFLLIRVNSETCAIGIRGY